MTNETTNSTRRTALKTVSAGLAAGLAGCFGGDSPSGENGNSSRGDGTVESNPVFDSITMSGTRFQFELQSDTDVFAVNVIDESGELAGETRVETGVTSASAQLGSDYTPGTYEFVAVDAADEEIASVEKTFEPDISISDTALATSSQEFNEEYPSIVRGKIFFEVRNEGNGSAVIEELVWANPQGEVNPEDWDGTAPAYYDEGTDQPYKYAEGGLVLGPGESEEVLNGHRDQTSAPDGDFAWYCEEGQAGSDITIEIRIETRGGRTFEPSFDGEVVQSDTSEYVCVVRYDDEGSDGGTTTEGGA